MQEKKGANASDFQIRDIDNSVNENLTFIKNQLGESIGISEGKFDALGGKIEIGIMFIRSLCDKKMVNDQVISPLLIGRLSDNPKDVDICILVQKQCISSLNTKIVYKKEKVITELLNWENYPAQTQNCYGLKM